MISVPLLSYLRGRRSYILYNPYIPLEACVGDLAWASVQVNLQASRLFLSLYEYALNEISVKKKQPHSDVSGNAESSPRKHLLLIHLDLSPLPLTDR